MRIEGGHDAMMRAALDGARLIEAAAAKRAAAAEALWSRDGTADAREAFRSAHRALTEARTEVAEIEETLLFPEMLDAA